MIQKTEYQGSFQEHLDALNLARARFGYGLVALLMPAGSTLDWFTHADWVTEFAFIRLGSSVVALVCLWMTYLGPWAERSTVLQTLPALIAAAGVELMVMPLGAASSEYYGGLSLCIVALAVLHTWRWPRVLGLSAAIVAMWLIPAVPEVVQGQARWSLFYNNLYFLVLTTAIAVPSTQMRYRAAKREFEAREALAATSTKLSSALDRAREVDRLKSEFFANISHELRTPLTLILSPVDELLSKLMPGVERDALSIVRRNAARLLTMIDDLLDLARLEAGGLRLKVMQLDMTSLARSMTENAVPAATAKGIDLTFSVAGEGDQIFGDPPRLEIIITNLIGNAIKFTPPGGRIDVQVFYNLAGASIEVADTGPGISKGQQDKVFERFHQTETSERRQQGGVGIGLALARELAQLHGGSLTVESKIGEGSTFTLFLQAGKDHFHAGTIERRQLQLDDHPRRRAEDKIGSEPPRPETEMVIRPSQQPPERVLLDRGRVPRVLVAEDENDLRSFIVGLLQDKYEVDAASDGREALELLKHNRPDLVLTDVMMPGTSGLDLCRAIKQDPSLRHIPVILLTARGENEAALEGYEAGADDFVSKPFHTKVLLARIRAHLKMRSLSLQLADQARLASAGTLAAGLAHEVKNPLNAAVNAAKVLERGGSTRVSNEKLMNIIIDALGRIDGVVSALDAHARPADGTDLTPCNVRKAVESTLNLLAHKLKDRVLVHQDYETTGNVFAPARAFNQVLLNLIDNSIRSGAQNIWIELRQLEKQVFVAVSDDGPGVPADVVHRIFDPFFTTRAEGEGTGLGLHLSRRIAQECGGELRYEPRSGGGARFVMEIPAMEQAA